MMDPDTNGSSGNPAMPFFADFGGLQQLVDEELSIDQVVAMIRGESQDPISVPGRGVNSQIFHHDHNNIDQQFCGINPEDVFANFNSPTMSCTDSTMFNSFSGFEDDLVKTGGEGGGEEEDNNYGEAEDSSATGTTTTTTTTQKKAKVDRSRTLISERRRRGRMKEKLYALRALVPNITKMDKASIVGDAVLYVQDLQMTAKKLKSEVEGLQSSLKAAERRQHNTPNKVAPTNHFLPVSKNIIQMDVLQIEDREFYVKVVSNKDRGVATSLYKALETFTSFVIQNSNLTTVCERFILTFTLNVGKCREDLSLPNLKLWMTGAFLKQGFEFQAS